MRFETCLDDPATARAPLRCNKETCTSASAGATATFFVNGDIVRGELWGEEMSKTIADIGAVDD